MTVMRLCAALLAATFVSANTSAGAGCAAGIIAANDIAAASTDLSAQNTVRKDKEKIQGQGSAGADGASSGSSGQGGGK
jgi:hypothetical protein